jgi:uncharacterized protein YbcI
MDDEAQTLSDETPGERRGVQMAELSTAMVKIYKEQFGREPRKAHSAYATPDLVISTLENSLTPAEMRLAQIGEHQRLRDTRMFFQHVTDKEFVAAVEQITGRKVRAFVSGIDTPRRVVEGLLPRAARRPRRRRGQVTQRGGTLALFARQFVGRAPRLRYVMSPG